ncbi:MAG: hypothetical protein EOP49_12490 [Sphingobacteriales bacterium]|nr:MAG: hypothetical protein EOP49_12490 [Sphingobacteriales bacterium]
MDKQIMIPFYIASTNNACVIPVAYSISRKLDFVIMNCIISEEDRKPYEWLRTGAFELKGIYQKGAYNLVLNDSNRINSLDASEFIRQLFQFILTAENLNKPDLVHSPGSSY